MKGYILRKALAIVPMLFLISFIIFLALVLSPTDPISYLVSPDMAQSAAQIEALKESLGLNDSIFTRYFRWLINALQGDFGYSIVSGTSIMDILKIKLIATFELSFAALFISTVLGIALGIISAIFKNGVTDNVIRFCSVLSMSIPNFFFGIILLNFLAIQLNLLPIGGRYPTGEDVSFFGRIHFLILPAFTMALPLTAVLLRYTRNSMLDIMSKDYVKTARAKGIAQWKVYTKHVFRNALQPLVVLLVFRLPILIGGSVIIENIFSWPGIGQVILTSMVSGDYPVIMVTTLLIATVILLASLLGDILAALLDPRIRY